MSLDKPNIDPILDPAYARSEATKHFSVQLSAAREIADYGSQLLKRLFATCGRDKIEDLVIIAALFRQGLVAFDGVVLCLENGAVDAANLHARSLLEVDLYVEWILTKGKERWGRQLYVANLRQEREWARRVIVGTDDYNAFANAWQQSFDKSFKVSSDVESEAKKQIAEVDRILALPNYRDIDGWFDTAKSARGLEPDWFKPGPGAPRSIFNIADQLSKRAWYVTLYKMFSYHVHGTRTKYGFSVKEDGLVGIEPARALVGIPGVFTPATSIWIGLCRRMIIAYRPQEVTQFGVDYLRWRDKLVLPDIREDEQFVRF